MAKVLAVLLLLLLVLTLILPRGAAGQQTTAAVLPLDVEPQGPVTPQHTDPYWSAAYWNTVDLTGDPEVVRSDTEIQFNWETGSPSPEIEPDTFSARWQRYIDVAAGTYRFTITSDDGVRLWIDGNLVLDEWHDHAVTTYYVDYDLTVGHHLLQVDYYENTGVALINVTWVPADQAVGQWQAEYFNNITLSGTPTLVRHEPTVDFNWETGSPAQEINSDQFSARYATTIDFPANNYTFLLTTDDGARLWVNGHLLIDAWYEQAANLHRQDIYLSGGPVTLELEYFEATGLARLQLDWEPGRGEVPTDDVVVDNLDPGFVRGGTPSDWHTVAEGFANNLYWTRSNAQATSDYNWARWYPTLSPGTYEVFAYIPYRYTTTSAARYWVAHADGLTLQIVDQSNTGCQWVSLGIYQFRGTGGEYVSLADVTFEPEGDTRLVAFDAVRWIAQ